MAFELTTRDCVKITAPFYNDWVGAGKPWSKPDCWCYQRQCRGDANGSAVFGKWVTSADLDILKSVYNDSLTDVLNTPGGICADFNHLAVFGKPVTSADLDILKLYYNEGTVDCCDDDGTPGDCVLDASDPAYNFWTN
jgi:hypothetical protein